MSGNLTPDTNIALLQATQTDIGKAAAKAKNAAQSKELEKIEHAAQDFEAVFIAEMLKPMFEGISTEPPFGGGKGEEVFRSMMLQEYGKIVAQTGGVGLADHVKEQMIEIQNQANGQPLEGAPKDE